ncbi:hypothetical protein MKX01_035164 [Papaver californicum]|nr:hypothetical protein MKX01_035164 [Papaver californicum]
MGTREVYEQKLRSGNIHYDPTINPGLGIPRCPRCLSPISPNYSINGVLHDFIAVWIYPYETKLFFFAGIPFIQKHVKGPNGFLLLLGIAFVLYYCKTTDAVSSAHLEICSSFSDSFISNDFSYQCNVRRYLSATHVKISYAVPMFAQMSVTSYYAASSNAHYGIITPDSLHRRIPHLS